MRATRRSGTCRSSASPRGDPPRPPAAWRHVAVCHAAPRRRQVDAAMQRSADAQSEVAALHTQAPAAAAASSTHSTPYSWVLPMTPWLVGAHSTRTHRFEQALRCGSTQQDGYCEYSRGRGYCEYSRGRGYCEYSRGRGYCQYVFCLRGRSRASSRRASNGCALSSTARCPPGYFWLLTVPRTPEYSQYS